MQKETFPLLELKLQHLRKMTDQTGLFQHATLAEPNLAFGYCTDDNARALLFVSQALAGPGSASGLEDLLSIYFRFVQSAFGADAGSLRNLRGYDGEWVPEDGPGDATGRTLWALGSLVQAEPRVDRRMAARVMFDRALPMVEALHDLRPISCAILGLCAYLKRRRSPEVLGVLEVLANRLYRRFESAPATTAWPWPEALVTYENARLPQALIGAGQALQNDAMVQRGLTSLRWLIEVQTREGLFAPIGNEGWYVRGGEPARFDQQPIEADATIAACLEAYRADGDVHWLAGAETAYKWFLGENATGFQVCNPETGGCRDGLSPDSVNQNQGAESTLAWLTSQVNMQTLAALSEPSSLAGAR